MREFLVKPALNGFIVSIGCKTLVFSSRERLVRSIERYLEDPTGTERDFLENSLNAKHLGPRQEFTEAQAIRGPMPVPPQPYSEEYEAPAPEPSRF